MKPLAVLGMDGKEAPKLRGVFTVQKWTDEAFAKFKSAEERYHRVYGLPRWLASRAAAYRHPPYETAKATNTITRDNGARVMLLALTGGAFTAFNAANSNLGVGDSTTANPSPNTFTDLQAAVNKVRVGMNATFPSVPAAGAGSNIGTWQADFGSAVANFVWNEFALFNANAGGDMLSRGVQNFGTKVSGTTWRLTYTLTLS